MAANGEEEWARRFEAEPAVLAAHDELGAAIREAARRGPDEQQTDDHKFEVLFAFRRLVDVEHAIDERRRQE